MTTGDLFDDGPRSADSRAPLAERMRPGRLNAFVGQRHLVGDGKILSAYRDNPDPPSLILWGPPGSGKTTLAHILAAEAGLEIATLSAVQAGVKQLKEIVQRARRTRSGKRTLLFVDEIHRFNKAQQDGLLPHVESGIVVLIGATTENPSFEVIRPLLSRARVVILEPLDEENLATLVDRALADPERGLGALGIGIEAEARELLARFSGGDARRALNALEVAAQLAAQGSLECIGREQVREAVAHRALDYDRDGEEHFNLASAFIKSLRGSDPDAALYWMVRMLEAGEDPRFVVRRMIIFAAEDIGNADPGALELAIAASRALDYVGLPEARIPMAQAATYLASAPRSNAAYAALNAAIADVREHGSLPVPLHLRNAPTGLMKELGYGKDYRYAHDYEGGVAPQGHLPEQLLGRRYYEPTDRGAEKAIRTRLAHAKKLRDDAPDGE